MVTELRRTKIEILVSQKHWYARGLEGLENL